MAPVGISPFAHFAFAVVRKVQLSYVAIVVLHSPFNTAHYSTGLRFLHWFNYVINFSENNCDLVNLRLLSICNFQCAVFSLNTERRIT